MPTKREQFQQPIRAQFLGDRMRRLREERGLTLKYIAAFLGVEFSTLARYERAEWPFRPDHVSALLDVYGVFEEKLREELVTLARNAWRVCAWEVEGVKDTGTNGTNNQPVIDPWWIQSRAEELCVYAPAVIPPLLRARDYAETMIRYTDPQASMMKVENQVRQLTQRQHVLEDKPPVRLTVILEQDLLSRRLGGPAVMAAQLEHLTRAVERPHVNVLVLPAHAALHPGLHGGFTLCRMRPPYPPVVLLEQLVGRAVIESGAALRYQDAFDKLKETAFSVAESMGQIMRAADELGGTTSRSGQEAATA